MSFDCWEAGRNLGTPKGVPRASHFSAFSQVPTKLDSAPAIRKTAIPVISSCPQTSPANATDGNAAPNFSATFAMVTCNPFFIIFLSFPVDRDGLDGFRRQ